MFHHLLAGRGVEIPGGLVGEEEARPVDQRAGDRHPLLLAAGELAGIVPQPVVETHRGQLHPSPIERVGLARELAGRGHVLDRGHGGDEVEGLEDDPHVTPPELCELVFVQGAEIVAGHGDPSGGGPFQSADDHEQRGLAGAGGSDHADRFPGRQLEVDAAQDLHRPGRAGQCDVEIAQRYDGSIGGGRWHGECFHRVLGRASGQSSDTRARAKFNRSGDGQGERVQRAPRTHARARVPARGACADGRPDCECRASVAARGARAGRRRARSRDPRGRAPHPHARRQSHRGLRSRGARRPARPAGDGVARPRPRGARHRCRRVGRHHRRRARAARMGAGRSPPCRGRRARGQRRPARDRPGGVPLEPGSAAGRALPNAACRCSSPGCWRRATSDRTTARASTRSTRTSPPRTTRSSIRSCSTVWPRWPRSTRPDGLHPNEAGVEVIVERILPSVLCLARRSGHRAVETLASGEQVECSAGRQYQN